MINTIQSQTRIKGISQKSRIRLVTPDGSSGCRVCCRGSFRLSFNVSALFALNFNELLSASFFYSTYKPWPCHGRRVISETPEWWCSVLNTNSALSLSECFTPEWKSALCKIYHTFTLDKIQLTRRTFLRHCIAG